MLTLEGNETSLCIDQYTFYRSHIRDAVLLTCGSGTVLAPFTAKPTYKTSRSAKPHRVTVIYVKIPHHLRDYSTKCCFRAQVGPMRVYGAASHTIRTAMVPRGRSSAENCLLSRGFCYLQILGLANLH